MLKTLQRDERPNGATERTVRTTTLVIDSGYTTVAIDVIKKAKTELRLCAYAWRWYENEPEIGIQRLNMELLRAQKRGVIVRCLVDTEYLKAQMKARGFDVRSVHPKRMLHTKAICADVDKLLIGSHNLTKRANTDNYEMSVLSNEFEVCAQFVEYFDKIWHSRGS